MSSSGHVRLAGDQWAARSDGYLAVEIVSGLVLASCLIFVRSFKWTFKGPTDTTRTTLFTLSTISAVIYFILDLTSLGEDEENAVVSYYYYILYIFTEFFFQISEFAILLVIARTVNLLAFRDFANQGAHRAVRFLTFFLIGIVGAVSITTFGLYAGYCGYLASGLYAANLVPVTIGFFVAYGAVYLTASLYLIVVAICAAARERSKVSALALVVAINLMIRAMFYLLDMAVTYYSPNRNVAFNVNWTVNYLYDILTIGIYIGVTSVALFSLDRDPMPKTDSAIELAPSVRPYVKL